MDDVHRIASWTDEAVIDIGADQIQEIRLTAPNGNVLEVRRTEEAEKPFELVNMPPDRQFATFYTLNEITDGLADLTFEDVRGISGMTFEPSLGNAIYQTRGGLTVIVDFAEIPGTDGVPDIWTHFSMTLASDATDEARRLCCRQCGEGFRAGSIVFQIVVCKDFAANLEDRQQS